MNDVNKRRNKEIAKKIEDEINDAFSEKDIDEIDLSSLEKEIKKDIPKTPKKKRKLKKTPIYIIIGLLIAFLLILLVIIVLKPRISIIGESKMKIPYNSEYNDKGATAKVLGKDISSKYKVDYSVKNILPAKKTRIVEVVDEVPPTIKLEGEEDLTICPNAKFEEPGYTAEDEYDGDLTSSVVVDEKDESVTYTVKDSSNNSYSITRTLTRKDEEKPEISLNGGTSTVVILNTTYKDPGYTATDNCSGDITAKVTKSGSVDTTKEGTYEIKYTVSDDKGNETIVSRKVTVQKNYPQRGSNFTCGEAGVIYLTFDDGPSNSTTGYLLDVLKKYNVKATFFVTNRASDDLIKREYDEGHAVALHTASHEYSVVYASPTAYFNDLNSVSERVERITGKKSNLIRFPGGSSNTVSRHYYSGIMSRLVNEVEAKGYTYFDWNVDSRDAETATTCSQVSSNTINGLSKTRGNVVLMHDIHTKTTKPCGNDVSAVEKVIKYGLENGYTFKTLDSSVKCWHRTNN